MDNKKLKSSWAAAFTVASVWFGTHVGAGFATGNQVVNYFVQYGWTAAIFPLLAMGILAVVMYIMMKFAKLNGFDNYKDTYRALYPKPWMEVFFEIFYIIIILAAVASCVDGAGGIVKSLIDLPDIICNLVIIALLILLSIFGVDLIIKASTKNSKDEKDAKGKYIRKERYEGSCNRSFYVGDAITQDDIKAKFEDGVLKISVPKKEAKPQVEEKKFIAIEG